ncbi:hypothetical protein CXB51_022736 [Gossypium anomalum]|uniref:Tic22-like family protein n=1 Tax=Gossypium anomalum TaxID=47600 RepID=A0A8J5Y8L6_9ROSI|nr:hypothetical protein CXB51_022736 [Gossypium anomalum]
MGLPTDPPHHQLRRNVTNFFRTTTTSLFSHFSTPQMPPCLPFADSPLESDLPNSISSKSAIKGVSSAESSSGFPSTVRISGLNSAGKCGGPAFVGRVFSMCDLSGTGLMAISTHFNIPFISERTPEWLKKIFANITTSERNGPVFRFFIDLGDAVNYVKRLNIPSGVVGACRLDLAYDHFKENPHLFQFVPNEKQVKAANKILKKIPQSDGKRKVDGVPVFGAQNLDIAIVTTDGIKWYTPYFFDKNMLDDILEESVDQHFGSLIQNRHIERRKDVVDDNLSAEVIEEIEDSMWEPPEAQEFLDEVPPAIPLSVISKATEIQLLYAVDKVLLGNRWLRKAMGIQPKFPYMVDSFERRSASSFLRASEPATYLSSPETHSNMTELKFVDNANADDGQRQDFRFPLGDWFSLPWLKHRRKPRKKSDASPSKECKRQHFQANPLLPKITMVGISTGDGQMSESSLNNTMDDLIRELESTEEGSRSDSEINKLKVENRDPLFVANVGDYHSGLAKTDSARWFQVGKN